MTGELVSGSPELLQLLHGARHRFESIHAHVTARRRIAEVGGGQARTTPRVDIYSTVHSEVWLRKPWLLRVDQTQTLPVGAKARRVLVKRNDELCHRADDGRWLTLRHTRFGFEFMFDPAHLLCFLDLDEGPVLSALGRPAWIVRGRRRVGAPVGAASGGLGQGDEYILHVDREYGVVLRAAATSNDVETVVFAISDISFDIELSDALFEI